MNVIERWKQRAKVQAAHEEELNTLHTEYATKIRAIRESHKSQLNKKNDAIVDLGNEHDERIAGRDRECSRLAQELLEATQQIAASKKDHERMEKLLTKLDRRKRIYRDMMKAVAAWEEEIALEREEDKLEVFIKWKNDRQGEEEILT